MPSRRPSVLGTPAVGNDGRGVPVRISATKPECPSCGSDENVVRIWHGGLKMWACSKCYKITSTEKKPATLLQRVMHRLPGPDTVELGELLPNRKARRRQGR